MKPFGVTLLIMLAVLTGSNSASGAPDDAAAILAKYRTYIGWTLGDNAIRSVRIKGRIADQSTFDEICEPSHFAQYNRGIQSGRPFLVSLAEGSGFISHDGTPSDFPTTVAEDAFTLSLLLCNAFALYPADMAVDVASAGTNSRSGYAVIALFVPHEPLVLVSINKDTGDLTSVAVNGIASYEPSDLKSIGGGRKIFTRWKRLGPSGTSEDATISAIQLNVRADPAIFARNAVDVPPPADPAPITRF